ncbi:TlpA disulfide reductase family protein [Pedobacter metabolipauper]|uniref:Peroxiredoxin n=1 Tax=Pedobacter metabolipauper TaxID=425513 RepID=A0A4V3D0S9_9SPHI|nr:TlpA disulfide reductase family protein [Pedobacter metabolipauper]TDQ07168.1 peroxiredoxin [Pedobacter metabolipauper]
MAASHLQLNRYLISGLFIFSLQLIAVCTFGQQKFTISGKLTGGAGKTLYLSADGYIANTDKQKSDSVVIGKDDSFQLSGKIKYPGLYTLFFNGQKSFLIFYLDQTPVTIAGNADVIYRSNVSGSEDEKLKNEFFEKDGVIQRQMEANLSAAQQAKKALDTITTLRYSKKVDSLNQIRKADVNDFMASHPVTYQTLQNMEAFLGSLIPYDTAEKYLVPLSKKFAANPIFIKVSQLIAGNKRSAVGQTIPDIVLPDTTTKNTISLKDLRAVNHYVLIDFWASWCAPCRVNTPALQKMYSKYKPQKFEILGISLDASLASWKKAIREDQTNWPQASDLKGMDNKFALMLDVQTIPLYMLVDKTGKVILRTHKIQEVEEKMEQLFK